MFGGTRGDIARLLLFRYSKSVFWSAVIAMPFSWFIAQRWLQDYTHRIELEVLFFVVPIFVTLLLVWGVSFPLVMQIANTSPAQVLQCEKTTYDRIASVRQRAFFHSFQYWINNPQ